MRAEQQIAQKNGQRDGQDEGIAAIKKKYPEAPRDTMNYRNPPGDPGYGAAYGRIYRQAYEKAYKNAYEHPDK